MFESLFGLRDVYERPWIMFLWAVIICCIAVIISAQISYIVRVSNITVNLSGLFTVIFIIVPSIYLITSLIKREERVEEREIVKYHKKSFWERHARYIMIFLLYFLGLTVAFAAWSFFLPDDFFQVQNLKIDQIRGGMSGSVTDQSLQFSTILGNNLQVMFFSFVLSLFFGAGAVFIIAWNASILGVYVGSLSKHILEIGPITLQFLPHGLIEIGAYVCAGLAGGIISAVVLRRNDPKVVRLIMFDSLKILVLAVLLIVLGAVVEVYL